MAQHTPGPWAIVPEAETYHRWVIGDHEGGSIAECKPIGPWMSPEEADANARLIAASPDLLAMLRLILPLAKGYAAEHSVGSNTEYVAAAEAAIARAERL